MGWPTLFCNALSIDANGAIADYHLRQPDGKRHVVKALQGLNFKIIAMGDSYNDISMLKSAEHGFLFRPPQNIVDEYPQFPVAYDYPTIRNALAKVLDQE